MSERWLVNTYPSGSVAVSIGRRFYFVKANPATANLADARERTAKAIADFLNGDGPRPPILTRNAFDSVTMQSGVEVLACTPKDPRDESDNDQIEKWKMIEALCEDSQTPTEGE